MSLLSDDVWFKVAEILSATEAKGTLAALAQTSQHLYTLAMPLLLSDLDESKLQHIVTLAIAESFNPADLMRFKLPNLKQLFLNIGPPFADGVEMDPLVWIIVNLKTLNQIYCRGETYGPDLINFIMKTVPNSNKGTSINELAVEYNHSRSMNLLNGQFKRGAMRLSVHGQYDRVKTLLQAKRKRDVEAVETYEKKFLRR